MNTLLPLLALATIGSIFGLVGGLVFLYVKPWSAWLARYSIPFAAGILLTVSLIGILPEAVHELEDTALYIVLASFLASFLFEHLVMAIHHHDGEHHSHAQTKIKNAVPLILTGDSIHNFVDGAVIAAAYITHPGLGVVTALATFLHEVPHEIGDFGLLVRAGWSRKRIILANFVSALTTFLGVGAVAFFSAAEDTIAGMLAVAAGMFLYLAASDFLPDIHDSKIQPFKAVAALLSGVAAVLIVLWLVPHAH